MYFLSPGVKECIYCFCKERWRNRTLKRRGLHGRTKALIYFFFSSFNNSIKEFLTKEKSFIVRFPTVCVEIYLEFYCII